MKKITIISATRAEYGILKPLIVKLKHASDFKTQLILTGSHLVEKLGNTYLEAEEDGMEIYKKISINTEGNTDYDTSLIMANALVEFGRYFQEEKPDLLIVLGDRTEIFAICAAAMNAHVPIAHLHGGELTQGAIDDNVRHAITKMSYLHFASAEAYRKRILQMGEEPERVFNVGALGVENILKEKLLDRKRLGENVGFPAEKDYAVVTFHPVTLEPGTAESQVRELFLAMRRRPELFYLITKANADAGGIQINEFMERETVKHSNMKLVSSLGVPTVNIGDRQQGRIMAESVISCEPQCQSILDAMALAMHMEQKKYHSPYGDGNTSEQIVCIIKDFFEKEKINLKKRFYDIPY